MESQETNNDFMPVENSMDVSPTTSSTGASSTKEDMSDNDVTIPESTTTSESTMTSSSSMNMENSMAPSNEPTTTVEEVVLENKNKTPSNNEETTVAKSPAAKGRSNKQRKSDENAAEMLQRMRNMWSREFADVPEKSRPKPPSWAARAAMYKTGVEQEEYLQNLIRESRNSLMAKNSSDYNAGLGNNTEMLVEQLITGLDNVTKIARQLKNVTRKGASARVKNSSMNSNVVKNSAMNSNVVKNSSMNSNIENNYNTKPKSTSKPYNNIYNSNNTYNSNNNSLTRRVSPLTKSKKLSQSRMKTSKKPRSAYNEPPLEF
jgi:hypothetical protein